jgi:hypothetical protein
MSSRTKGKTSLTIRGERFEAESTFKLNYGQSPHSLKALKTLELMNTKPEDWGLVEILWKQEMRAMPEHVRCPDCVSGLAWVTPEGKPHNFFKHCKGGLSNSQRQEQIKEFQLKQAQCPTCPPSRKWPGRGTAEVVVFKDRLVWVGYPQWHKDTRFDSRFEDALYNTVRVKEDLRCVCALCSKSIGGTFSYRVPVTAKGADGVIHGMWVGADCARKFFGVKNFKKDHIIKGSETK